MAITNLGSLQLDDNVLQDASGNQLLGAQQAAEANATAYTAHASGGTTVTSNAATDLDTTAAQVAILTTTLNSLLVKLRTHGIIAT